MHVLLSFILASSMEMVYSNYYIYIYIFAELYKKEYCISKKRPFSPTIWVLCFKTFNICKISSFGCTWPTILSWVFVFFIFYIYIFCEVGKQKWGNRQKEKKIKTKQEWWVGSICPKKTLNPWVDFCFTTTHWTNNLNESHNLQFLITTESEKVANN